MKYGPPPSAAALVSFVLLSGCGAPGKTPVPANQVTDFQTLYSENCAACHGADGKDGAAQALNSAEYLAFIPEPKLKQVIENGVPGYSMPAFAHSSGGPLYPKQIAALIEGMEKNWCRPGEFENANMPSYDGDGGTGDPNQGQQIFHADCASCHAVGKKGGPIAEVSYLELVSNQNLRTATVVGRPSLGMPDWRGADLKSPSHEPMGEKDVTDVVAYLASLRPSDTLTQTSSSSAPSGEAIVGARGNQASGNGLASPPLNGASGNVPTGSSSQSGGVGASSAANGAKKHQ